MSRATAYIDGQQAAMQALDDVLTGVANPDTLHNFFSKHIDGMKGDDPQLEDCAAFIRGYFRTIQKTVEARQCLPH